MFAPSVLHHGDGHWPRPGQKSFVVWPSQEISRVPWRGLGSPGCCDGCPMSAAHPNSLVFGRRSRAVPVCPPSPIISVRSWEFGNWEKRQCRRAVDPIPSPSSTTTSPLRTSPPWVLSSLRFPLSCHARGPRATKTTNPDARRLALREELTFPSSSLASVAGSSEPGLLLSSTSDRRQRPRSTPTSLRVAPRIVLGTLHRTTAPFRKGRRRSFNLNLNHNHHIHLAQVHETP